jgi:uncharacterized protein YndB with AHSA1/START domain
VVQIKRTIRSPRPVTEVFDYLADFTHTNEWDPGTVETRLVSGSGGVGTTYHNTSRFRRRETELTYVVTDLAPAERIVLRGENKTLIATDTMLFASTPTGGTEVTYTADFAFKGLAKLVAPFLNSAFQQLGDEAETGMRKALA